MKSVCRDRLLTAEEAAHYKRLRELVEQDRLEILRFAEDYERRRGKRHSSGSSDGRES